MIRETFSFVGDIKSITIPWDRNQDKPKQFAFMELADKDSAQVSYIYTHDQFFSESFINILTYEFLVIV